MDEGNLLFGPARFSRFLSTLPPRSREALRCLYAWVRRDAGPARAPALESRAARVVREYLETHAANLERAARLAEKAERLEEAGIPSESVRNRAQRARREVVAELAALRASFIEAVGGRDGARAFDRVVGQRCPAFAPYRLSDGRTW